MNRRGLGCDMDSGMYQEFSATEFVDMFPQTNGDILVHTILVWIGSRWPTSIRTYRAMWRLWCWCQEKISKYQKVAYFRAFSEVVISSLTDEKVRPYYTETYLLRKCVSGCDLGLDNANWVCGLDVRDFEVILKKEKSWQQIRQLYTKAIFGQWIRCFTNIILQ